MEETIKVNDLKIADIPLNGEIDVPSNGELRGCEEGPLEVPIPEDLARLISAAGELTNRALLQVELAQVRAESARKSYDLMLFKACAKMGVDPDEVKLDAREDKLVFVKAAKK